MGRSERITCWTISGIIFIALSLCLVIIASALPYWQEMKKGLDTTDTGIPNIGLWEICFGKDGFVADPEVKDVYGNRYYGCNYVFDRDLRGLVNWIFQDWFITVVVFVTLGLLLLPLGLIVSVIYMLQVCSPHYEHILLISSSLLSMLNGLLTAIAIIVFGICAGKKKWVVSPQSNHLSYSYAVCAFVPVFCIMGSTCHFVDFVRVRAQRLLNARAKVYAKGEFDNRM